MGPIIHNSNVITLHFLEKIVDRLGKDKDFFFHGICIILMNEWARTWYDDINIFLLNKVADVKMKDKIMQIRAPNIEDKKTSSFYI